MNNSLEDFNINQLSLDKQCIIAKKVCDLCTQRECLTPILKDPPTPFSKKIAPALSDESHKICYDGAHIVGTDIIIAPGEQIEIPADVTLVKLEGEFSVDKFEVVSIEPAVLMSTEGYWRVRVDFTFVYPVKLFKGATEVEINEDINDDASDWPKKDCLCACTQHSKTVILYGGEIEKYSLRNVDIVSCDSLYDPCKAYSTESPFALAQAEASLLKIEPGTVPAPAPSTDTIPVINATIGLFSIIKTYRDINIQVQTTGDCINEENPCTDIPVDDPCEFFGNIDFPFKDFNPTCPLGE